MLWGGPESVWPLSSFPALPRPLQPPSGTITYSVGEGKYWKSGDLQFLQKRNSLARSLPFWCPEMTVIPSILSKQ